MKANTIFYFFYEILLIFSSFHFFFYAIKFSIIFFKEECLDLPPLVRTIVKIEICKDIIEEYENIIRSMKSKMNKKSFYSGQNNNNEENNSRGNSYAGNSSSLEMMSQLRIFTSKSKVNIIKYHIWPHFIPIYFMLAYFIFITNLYELRTFKLFCYWRNLFLFNLFWSVIIWMES